MRARGGELRVLSHVQGRVFWLALYQKVPGFAALSEFVYSIIAAHRAAAYRATVILWAGLPAPNS